MILYLNTSRHLQEVSDRAVYLQVSCEVKAPESLAEHKQKWSDEPAQKL